MQTIKQLKDSLKLGVMAKATDTPIDTVRRQVSNQKEKKALKDYVVKKVREFLDSNSK